MAKQTPHNPADVPPTPTPTPTPLSPCSLPHLSHSDSLIQPADGCRPKKRKPYVKHKSWRKPYVVSSRPRKWSFKGILVHNVCPCPGATSSSRAVSSTAPPDSTPLPDLNDMPPQCYFNPLSP